ncbi:hypothetical protein [Neisseria sp. Ec49-e6-T10]|uniref:hypothetical protein n=1 Tax=Neisseria sp. Ec49-e6-T10 TaxID=3140744 RepID=UPI003EBAB055
MMRITLALLIPVFLLTGCSNEPVAWEDKTPEQRHEETKWWRKCYISNMKKTHEADFCNAEFKKEFGYPYKTTKTN